MLDSSQSSLLETKISNVHDQCDDMYDVYIIDDAESRFSSATHSKQRIVMDLSYLNQTVNAAAGKAQKSQGLSAQSVLASLAIYGSIYIAVLIFEFIKDGKCRK
jgi:hypothetical protein